jgi:transcriptional regulator with XRE-family HTH domain
MPDTRQNGYAIRTFREIRGLTRDQLAEKIDKSYPYLANIENEHKDPTPEVIHRIALVLDVPVAAIMRRGIYSEQQAAS